MADGKMKGDNMATKNIPAMMVWNLALIESLVIPFLRKTMIP
jgi:hypothetical protein